MKRIVVLNSGGFDSVILLNHIVSNLEEDCEVYSLHFKYGAPNEKEQLNKVNKVCSKLGVSNKVITLPKIDWSNSNFYEKDFKDINSQYLEYRNLIFLSYAISYAESIGADTIYLATLKSHGYNDTSETFFKGINSFLKPLSNIEVLTPFSEFEKFDLLFYAIKYGITKDDYFTCDTPIKGKPCGECDDCKVLNEIEDILELDTPHKVLVQNGFNYKDPRFVRLLKQQKVEEVRLLINNKCQLNCEHCFYGFENSVSDELSKEELYDVILQADKLGVYNIHFSGKEPLFNDDILWYAHKIQDDKLNVTFDIVTNGINIPKYAKELKECGLKKFYLSVDDISVDNGVRKVHGVTDRALKVCCEENIEVEIFLDLHKGNCYKIREIVNYLTRTYSCVKSFFIRTIRRVGNASNSELLSIEDLVGVYESVLELSDNYRNINFSFNIGIEYEQIIFNNGYNSLYGMIDYLDHIYSCFVRNNFILFLEDSCARYTKQVTITPDGYILGCALEVSCDNYDYVSVGNIKEYSLADLIIKGKEEVTSKCNNPLCGNSCKKCSFLYETT